mgnify:CR=1 FL=1
MIEEITTKLIILGFAVLPLSLIIIRSVHKYFSKHHPDLPSTTTICSRLDGTLTSNTWRVKTMLTGHSHFSIEENQHKISFENYQTREEKELKKGDLKNFEAIKMMAKITKLVSYEKVEKLEKIILKFLGSSGINTFFTLDNYFKIEEMPVKNKKFSTVVYQEKENDEIFAFSKGNPLELLEKCSRALIDGKKVEIDHPLKRKLKKRMKIMDKRGEKVIAYAYKPLPKKLLDKYKESYVENDLIFLGMLGIGDYPNQKLIAVVKTLKELGIKIFVHTSSRERRAIAIAKDLKIVNPLHFESITGSYLETLSDSKLKKILNETEKNYIFSELNEENKKRIIETLRNEGENVAIAKGQGQSGLQNILSGIREGRQNIKTKAKVSSHAISCKIAETILLVSCILLGTPLALSIYTILAIDLAINFFLQLSLKRDTSEQETSELRGHRVVLTGVLNGILITGLYLWSLMRFGWHPFSNTYLSEAAINSSVTLTFITLSIMQIVNAYNIKHSRESIFRLKNLTNIYLALSSVVVILVLYALSKFKVLGLASLSKNDFYIILFISVLLVLFEESRKIIEHGIPPRKSAAGKS